MLPGQGLPGHSLSKGGCSTLCCFFLPSWLWGDGVQAGGSKCAWEEARLRRKFGLLTGKTSLFFAPRKNQAEVTTEIAFSAGIFAIFQGKSCPPWIACSAFRSSGS